MVTVICLTYFLGNALDFFYPIIAEKLDKHSLDVFIIILNLFLFGSHCVCILIYYYFDTEFKKIFKQMILSRIRHVNKVGSSNWDRQLFSRTCWLFRLVMQFYSRTNGTSSTAKALKTWVSKFLSWPYSTKMALRKSLSHLVEKESSLTLSLNIPLHSFCHGMNIHERSRTSRYQAKIERHRKNSIWIDRFAATSSMFFNPELMSYWDTKRLIDKTRINFFVQPLDL